MTPITPLESAAALWRGVGGEPEALDGLTVEGDDPVLSSIFRVGTTAASAVAATTLAVAAAWRDRGGPVPAVSIDVREATTAFRSEQLLGIDGAAPKLWADLSGDYPSADGWVRLHCNFAHHQAAALQALGLESGADRDAVAAVVARRSSDAIVEAVTAASGCASELRPLDAWQRHPQGVAVGTLPLVAIDQIGPAPRRPFREAERPLGDLRVLDLTRVIAGPVCGRVLASHGANVLRVGAPHLPTFRVLDLDTGFGKRWCGLDLRDDEDRETFTALVREAHVVVQSYRPGALTRLGFSPDDLAELSPGIVVVSLSAYGQAGPWAARRGSTAWSSWHQGSRTSRPAPTAWTYRWHSPASSSTTGPAGSPRSVRSPLAVANSGRAARGTSRSRWHARPRGSTSTGASTGWGRPRQEPRTSPTCSSPRTPMPVWSRTCARSGP